VQGGGVVLVARRAGFALVGSPDLDGAAALGEAVDVVASCPVGPLAALTRLNVPHLSVYCLTNAAHQYFCSEYPGVTGPEPAVSAGDALSLGVREKGLVYRVRTEEAAPTSCRWAPLRNET
jgi:hypothetical protein